MLREFLPEKARTLMVNVLESNQSATCIKNRPTAVNRLLLTYAKDDNLNCAVNKLQ